MESDAIKRERLRLKKADKKRKLDKWHSKKIELANNWIENEVTQKNVVSFAAESICVNSEKILEQSKVNIVQLS